MSEKVILEGFDVDYESEDASQDQGIESVPVTPIYGSPEWNDYVMSLFQPDEMFNGNPLTIGLRRVAQMLLGSIISSKPVQVFPSMDPNGPGRATVVYEITFDWFNTGEFRSFGDVAETWHGNTDDLFCAHAAATACTKAEGRCLRKALCVRCLAAEELPTNKDVAQIVKNAVGVKITAPTNGEMSEEDKMSEAQRKFLEGKCKQLDIDIIKFINSGESQYNSIDEITKKTAVKMLQVLNDYQNKNPVPDKIKGYDPNWKK